MSETPLTFAFDELKNAQNTLNTAQKKLADRQQKVYALLYSEFEQLVQKHKSEPFVIVIEGSYQDRSFKGSPGYTPRILTFVSTVVGIINDEPKFEPLPEVPSFLENSLRFPAKKIIAEGLGYGHLRKINEYEPLDQLFLNFRNKDFESWEVTDFLNIFAPKDIREILSIKPHHSVISNPVPKPQISISIGTDEVSAFLAMQYEPVAQQIREKLSLII